MSERAGLGEWMHRLVLDGRSWAEIGAVLELPADLACVLYAKWASAEIESIRKERGGSKCA